MEISIAKFNEPRGGGGFGGNNVSYGKGPQPLRDAGGGFRGDGRGGPPGGRGGGDRGANILLISRIQLL